MGKIFVSLTLICIHGIHIEIYIHILCMKLYIQYIMGAGTYCARLLMLVMCAWTSRDAQELLA